MRKLAMVVAGVLAAGAAGAAGLPDGVPGQVELTSGADLRALCDELADSPQDAGQAVYVLTISSRSFAFAPYDGRRARLAIDGARGFRGSTGAWEMVLWDLTGRAAAPAGALDLAVPATKAEAAALKKLHQQLGVTLVLWFRPVGRAACAQVVAPGGEEGVRVAIEPLAFALMKGRERVASAETPEFARLREGAVPVERPEVVVATPVVTRTAAPAPEPVVRAAQALRPELVACYELGLRTDPQLRGSLVVGLTLDAQGRVTEARPELDGLGAPVVARCVVDKVRAARFPTDRAERFSLPLRFVAAGEP